jgi:hypothetical protein
MKQRPRRIVSFVILILLLGGFAVAQAPKPITKAGLLKALQIGGLSPAELVQQINTRGISFVLTPEVELELRAAGATPEVIEAVRRNSHAPSPTPTPKPPVITQPPVDQTPPAPAKAVVSVPGVYVRKAGQWVPLMQESVNWHKSGTVKKYTLGLGKGEINGSITGSRSPNSLHDPVTFLICPAPGVPAGDYTLVLLHDKKGIREVKVGLGGDSKNSVPLSMRKIGDRNYQVEFSQGSGEYGFLPPASNVAEGGVPLSVKMYTFSVE